jgi:hypothetical protein
VPQRIILVTPTYQSNRPYFETLKWFDPETDLHENYSDGLMRDIRVELLEEQREAIRYQARYKLWKRLLKARKIEREFDAEEILELEAMNWSAPEQPEFPWGRVTWLVLDDMVGTAAFKQGKSELTKLVLCSRHIGCNVLMLVQSIKALPKAIRINSSVFCLFRFASIKIVIQDLYTEVSGDLTEAEFATLYEYCVSQPHGSLVIDTTQSDPSRRYKLGWDTIVHLRGAGDTESESDEEDDKK